MYISIGRYVYIYCGIVIVLKVSFFTKGLEKTYKSLCLNDKYETNIVSELARCHALNEEAKKIEKKQDEHVIKKRLRKKTINCLFCNRKHKLPVPESEELLRYCNCGSAMFLGFDPDCNPFLSEQKRHVLEKEGKIKRSPITPSMWLIQFYPFTTDDLKTWFTEKEINTLHNKLRGTSLENKESGRVHRMRQRVEKMMTVIDKQDDIKLLHDILNYNFKAKEWNGVSEDHYETVDDEK